MAADSEKLSLSARLKPLVVVLAVPCAYFLVIAASWIVIPLIPTHQTITVMGDASANRATVYLDGAWVGALSDSIDQGPRAGEHIKDPQESFSVAPGNHRFTVISTRGDTLSCDVITKEHELVEVDFRHHEIMVRNRTF